MSIILTTTSILWINKYAQRFQRSISNYKTQRKALAGKRGKKPNGLYLYISLSLEVKCRLEDKWLDRQTGGWVLSPYCLIIPCHSLRHVIMSTSPKLFMCPRLRARSFLGPYLNTPMTQVLSMNTWSDWEIKNSREGVGAEQTQTLVLSERQPTQTRMKN